MLITKVEILSLSLQWLDKNKSAHFMGKAMSVRSVAALLAYGSIWLLMEQLNVSFKTMYTFAGRGQKRGNDLLD
ncbi:hypothetical protein M3P05_15080 [Sansalvadorimonas sp. 2012CJ34-2]|uniref:Transposase n=1 Tax=Parendozoicomonas callyspongiae TaxID=2942213 RepID=A0ABT0PIQ5_9GAMM|nr:hypothetical protein [Sansalvadorimonas sp. 2012CJ34-2]MCL6271248.1 hypothetical protein [Sansalvadorimonas sp. 2012CJ34-2]